MNAAAREYLDALLPGTGSAGSVKVPAAARRDEACENVDVSVAAFKTTRNTFALRVVGDSMKGRHILDGDIVILEHGAEPRSGQVVAALIDGKSVLKTFLVRGGRAYLRSGNPAAPEPIPSHELVIQGVARMVVRRAKGT